MNVSIEGILSDGEYFATPGDAGWSYPDDMQYCAEGSTAFFTSYGIDENMLLMGACDWG